MRKCELLKKLFVPDCLCFSLPLKYELLEQKLADTVGLLASSLDET
jgi:hypothetical protein